MTSFICPLCASNKTSLFSQRSDSGFQRDYFKCAVCALIFLSPEQRLSPAEEKKHYDSHENNPQDENYLKFLGRLAEPLSAKLKAGAHGIDFGCGPGPAMSLLFRKKGFRMEDYDPVYFPDKGLLNHTYDFAACSEVIEHFFEPGREFRLLDRLLKKGGWLGIMTGLLENEVSFQDWWYPKDPTHVCFYQPQTLKWIASSLGWSLELPQPNTALFQK